jgi:hypothetical protein
MLVQPDDPGAAALLDLLFAQPALAPRCECARVGRAQQLGRARITARRILRAPAA